MAGHTPGPWFRSGCRQKVGGADTHSIVATVQGKEIIIASVWYDPKTHEGFHDAGLMAAAPDHALVGWAMCVQDARWEEWSEGRGEFCFAGLCHATTLDEFGCPVLTDHLRAVLTKAQAESKAARAAIAKASA